jgi:uncharacterized protein YkwD
MRRAATTWIVLAALATGCGGGSDGLDGPPAAGSGSPSAAAVTPQASDGRLGGAVVAVPGKTRDKGGAAVITGKSVLPPPAKNALGAEDNCTDVELQPTPQNLPHVSEVVFCLMNAMRANAGVPSLRQQDLLAQASVGHSQDMVDNKYFAHDSLDGRDLVARLQGVSYIPKADQWVVGENLAWGAGALATPKALVNAWMNSPPHRENLLSGEFVEVGMGLVYGTPKQGSDDGVTVTTDFGTRGSVGAASASDAAADTAADATSADGISGDVAGTRTTAAAKRKKALRRCVKKRGKAKRRCVRAARRIRR